MSSTVRPSTESIIRFGLPLVDAPVSELFDPLGGKVQVGSWWVHDGVLLVGSTRGVFGIVDDPDQQPVAPGFVLTLPKAK